MAIRGSFTLFNSSFIGSSVGSAAFWDGGRSAVVISATQYANPQLQVQGPGGSWINIASSFLSDQLFVFDACPGQYRLVNQSGSSIGLVAALVPVKQNN